MQVGDKPTPTKSYPKSAHPDCPMVRRPYYTFNDLCPRRCCPIIRLVVAQQYYDEAAVPECGFGRQESVEVLARALAAEKALRPKQEGMDRLSKLVESLLDHKGPPLSLAQAEERVRAYKQGVKQREVAHVAEVAELNKVVERYRDGSVKRKLERVQAQMGDMHKELRKVAKTVHPDGKTARSADGKLVASEVSAMISPLLKLSDFPVSVNQPMVPPGSSAASAMSPSIRPTA